MVKKGPFIISEETGADFKLTGLLNIADVEVLRTLIIPALTSEAFVFNKVVVLTPTDFRPLETKDNLVIETYQQVSSLRSTIKDLKLGSQDILLVWIRSPCGVIEMLG